jgi:hypothetical protein
VNYETGCRHDDFLAQIKFAINDHHFKAERWQEIWAAVCGPNGDKDFTGSVK